MKRGASTVLAILGLLSLCRASTGALVVNSGNLHASATAFNNPNGATDSPPDKPLVLPSTSIVADMVEFGSYSTPSHGHADATVGQDGNGVISIDANTLITNLIADGADASATAETTGAISFTETEAQTLAWSFSMKDLSGDGFVRLWQTGSNSYEINVSAVAGESNRTGTVLLMPGDYNINWQLAGQLRTSVGGVASMQFRLIPEPSSASAVLATTMTLALWRFTRGRCSDTNQ